jgi:tryptophan 2,3-dioxygenase
MSSPERDAKSLLMRCPRPCVRWTHVHLTVTMRTFGAKPGYSHTPAVGWLRNRSDQTVFPELWSARTTM